MLNETIKNLRGEEMKHPETNQPFLMNELLADWLLTYGLKDRFRSYVLAEQLYKKEEIPWDASSLDYVKSILKEIITSKPENPPTILTIPVKVAVDNIKIEK